MKKKTVFLLIGIFLILVGGVSFIAIKSFSTNQEAVEKKADRKDTEEDNSSESIFSSKKRKEEKIKKELEILGKDFYENIYYDSLGENKEKNLQKFKEIGIKFDLNNLSRFLMIKGKESNIQELIDGSKGILCSGENTRVIFYPKEPYEKKDYRIEVELSCTYE